MKQNTDICTHLSAQVCILKPFTSCAASSERMVVALGRLHDSCAGVDVLINALNQQQQFLSGALARISANSSASA